MRFLTLRLWYRQHRYTNPKRKRGRELLVSGPSLALRVGVCFSIENALRDFKTYGSGFDEH